MRHLLRLVLGAVLLLGVLTPAYAQDFELPGLGNDAGVYAATLAKQAPAGATAASRAKAEQKANEAEGRHDYAAAATAWEARIGLGEVTAGHWMALARAQMRRTPPDAQHALLAAYNAFEKSETGKPEIAPLLLMADALRTLDRPAQASMALQAALDRAPDDESIKKQLADLRRSVGVLVRNVTTESEADPPRACIAFTVPPLRSDSFHPEDWVRLDPPVPGAAVTHEADQICVSGLPAGQTTKIILRAGLPGEDGLTLTRLTQLDATIANRSPRVVFDQRLFIMPRGQTPAITMTTVNLSAVKLTLARMTERNIVTFLRNNKLGEGVESYIAEQIGTDYGRVVWTGSAQVPNWKPNRNTRTALPLPDALDKAGPGVYALIAEPGDGTPVDRSDASYVQMIVRTDLAPTVWRGADGLTVQVRGYSDVAPRAGVKLQLVSAGNDILGETTTDADGVGHFAAPLLHGTAGAAPRSLHAFGPGDDFAALDLDATAFDLSDRGVSGAPQPGPLDAYVYTDRGIYRPGETVQVMALLRDAAGRPNDFPARVTVKRPNGQIFLQTTPARMAEAAIHLPVTLSQGASTGTWSVEVRSDPDADPIGRADFRVDAFVPDRMAVDLGPAPGPIVPGKPYALPLTARFLYGAPGAGLSGKATMLLAWDPDPFPALHGYTIGLAGETYAPESKEIAVPDTDGDGRSSVPVEIEQAPDTTHPLRASIAAEIDDPSGHASRAKLDVPVRPAGNLIGLKPAFADGAVDAGNEAGFDVAAVGPDGARIPLHAKLRLIREKPDWRYVYDGRLARYQIVWKDEPLETVDATLAADKPFHWGKKLEFGRYRVEVTEVGGLAATSLRFRSGWVATDNPDVPDQVDVSVDTRDHKPGETARVHIAAPFAGQATVLVLTDRVHSVQDVPVAAGGTDIEVPVSADWGPGAYVTVHVYRAADAKDPKPARAIGLAWIGVDPSVRTIAARIDVPEKLPPRQHADIPVHAEPGAWVTLSAVDEGILRLTNFASPDPAPHFFGRRTLGLDIRDDWGRLIGPAEGEATLLKQGGDSGFALPDVPIRTVVLFTPPVQAGADGIAHIPLDLPDFAGQVRLMAVTWHGTKVGSAHVDVLVRDPLVAEPLLPRFLAPGDDARFAVLMQNLELPAGEATADVSVSGPLQVSGPTHLVARLAGGAQATPVTMLHATGVGRAVIKLDVSGPGGFSVHRETAITVRPSRAAVTLAASMEVAPGKDARLTPAFERFIPGTATATASFGGPVRYDVPALVQALYSYPLMCLEQASSKGFPLVFLPEGPLAGPQRAERLQASVARVLDLQRYDGGFGLWRSSGDAMPWLSAYATEFLLRAKQAGLTGADPAIHDALKYLSETLDTTPDKPVDYAAQAYALYDLALAGQGRPGLARVFAQDPDKLPTPLARAQVAAALALAHDKARAEALFGSALDFKGRNFWYEDDGSALRDQMALVVLLKESELLPERLTRLVASLPGSDLDAKFVSTQESSWAIAAAATLGRDGRQARIAVDGHDLTPAPVVSFPLTGNATARNLDDKPVWQTVSVTGVPVQALPASRSQMRVQRKFFALDGKPLDLDHLRQNTVFVLLIEGRAEDGQEHQAMLLAGLPAGWEIAGRIDGEDAPGMPWLGKLTGTDAQPAADDRYAAVLTLPEDAQSFRIAVRLRAVTPGTYELPGTELSDMYRPAIYARQGATRITVLPVE
jgi:uncharacterized protein YfaS (alpha-2-macroglobulin family)